MSKKENKYFCLNIWGTARFIIPYNFPIVLVHWKSVRNYETGCTCTMKQVIGCENPISKLGRNVYVLCPGSHGVR